MQYVEDTVLTDADIAFYIAYTVFDARIYGCHCVFGSDGGGTTVCAGQGYLGGGGRPLGTSCGK